MTFQEMNLSSAIVSAVTACGYQEPTPIQRETIPYVLKGRDVLGCAQTGTGKTAAFALPILDNLAKKPSKPGARRAIRALVLTPTRELAMQIYESFVQYGKGLGLRSTVVFGGVSQRAQTDILARGVDILVATPGRLNDLCNQGYIALKGIEIFVLDEADRMLDMGFLPDVRKVVNLLPQMRQTLFFSATMPKEVEALAVSMLAEPATVKVDPVSSTVDKIDQALFMIDKVNKRRLLYDMLNDATVESALVFVRTKHGADKVQRDMEQQGIQCRAIHGDKTQASRQEALNAFKAGRIKALIATDIAARGLDIQGLEMVVNFDLPNEPEAYIHRIGRTGRAGRSGQAISFCCFDEMKMLSGIERLIGFRIPRAQSPYPMEVFVETVKQPRPPRPSRPSRPINDARPKDVTLRGDAKIARPLKMAESAFRENKFRDGKGHDGKPFEKKPYQGKPRVVKSPEDKSYEDKPREAKAAYQGNARGGNAYPRVRANVARGR